MNTNIFNTIFIEDGNVIKIGPNETIKKELQSFLKFNQLGLKTK